MAVNVDHIAIEDRNKAHGASAVIDYIERLLKDY